jgi:hypothetical protein
MLTAVPATANLDNIAGGLTGTKSDLLTRVLELTRACHNLRAIPTGMPTAGDQDSSVESLLGHALFQLAMACPLGGTLDQDISYWQSYAMGPLLSCAKQPIRGRVA